jgi:tRNA-dihydrouridine synthase
MSSFWHESIAFGSLKVPRVMAAPLDGVTDSPLRQLIRRFSTTELLYTKLTGTNPLFISSMRTTTCIPNFC